MERKQTEQLGTKPVGKLLLSLSAPAIAAQLINLLYNLVDRMYIGHIKDVGRLALTGVGVCLPLIMIISAFAALVSMGGAPRASIFLGKGEHENAERTLSNSVTMLLIISLILTVVFLIFGRDFLMVFGADADTIGYANDYLSIYSLGTIFVQLTLGLNVYITAQGFATTSMFTVLIGAITNIILDPIFIFGFNLGVSGAALATIISQALSCIWILIFLTGKKTTLKIRLKYMKLTPSIFLPVMALGLSPFIMQSTESLIAVCFNTSLLKYGGTLAVGAMTILTSVTQFSMMPLMGLTQGAQPIISFNYGAKNADRVKKAFHLLLISCVTYSAVLWALAMIVPQLFILIFNNDPELVAFGSSALRIYFAVNCVFGIQIACQQTFIALGNAKTSLFLALLRKVFLLIPLIYIMPAIFTQNKTNAVFMAEPVADFMAVTTTAIMFYFQFKAAMKKISASEDK